MTKRRGRRRWAILVLLAVTVAAFWVSPVKAQADSTEAYDTYYDYIITSYHVDVVAHTDNTYDIVETIDVRFNAYKHGIYRYIPMRYDGKLTPVTHINTYGEKAKIKNVGINKYIRLGDANQTIIGDKRYVIGYTLNMGKDLFSDVDAVYLNIIGTDWGTKIYETTFNIDVSELAGTPMEPSVSVGYAGSTESQGVLVEKNGSFIQGRTLRTLMPYEGLTLYVSMPEGVLAPAKDAFDFRKIFTFGVPLAALIVFLYVVFKYGGKREPIPVIEFYPPEGLNPTELGYVIDERVDSEDIGALLVYWAAKGYLSIKEERFGRFTLTKTGDMGVGHAAYEVSAFNRLWKLGDGTQVKSGELRNKYYTQVAKIQSGAKTAYEFGAKRLYKEGAKKASGWLLTLGAVCLGVLAFVGVPSLISEMDSAFGSGLMTALMFAGGYIFLSVAYEGTYKRRNKRKKGLTVLFYILHIILDLSLLLFGTIIFLNALTFGEVMALLMVPFLIMLVRPTIQQYTDFGFQLLQRVLGFKEFIKTAEKSRLEVLIKENPAYIYDILPFALVLGVSDIWAKKFNVLMTEPPNWYTTYGTGTFTTASLMNSMTRTTSSMSSVAASRPSSSGSSGGGGGGFSGGGGGGGGGGSW